MATGGKNSEKGKSDLTQIMVSLVKEAEGNEIKMREVLCALEHRGFGPLLIAPALLIILPTGAIPGLPAICGLFMLLISIQILIGKSQPWLPEKLKNLKFDKTKFEKSFQKFKPYTRKIDKRVQHRFEFLTKTKLAKRIVALLSVLLSIGIISIGFVPMMPALLALPILFFALGLSVRDGALMAAGYVILAMVMVGLPYLMNG